MSTSEAPRSETPRTAGTPGDLLAETPTGRWPAVGIGVTLGLVLVATALPPIFGWDVHARVGSGDFPPLHGEADVKVGLGTVPSILLAVLGWRWGADLAARLPWRRLLLVSYVVGLAWLFVLALVDGPSGLTRVLGNEYEYLPTARAVADVPTMLQEFISRIPYSAAPDNWPTHVAGHPVGALLFFVALVRIGLGGDLAAALVVTVLAATTVLAVLITLRSLGGESAARRAAPFLVLTPAAVFMAVSADAFFAAVGAWGLCALALAATAPSRGIGRVGAVAWAVLAGLLLGCCVLLSYGLPLLGVLALAVLLAARTWWPLAVTAVAALVPVLVLAALGFAWWSAYPVLTVRYYDGVASLRPTSYWVWGNFAALAYGAGPVLGAGIARMVQVGGTGRARAALASYAERVSDRAVLLLAGAALLAVLIADVSGMSKAEVERIWLPFIPYMTLSLALLPERWRRWGLAGQLVAALLVQHLLYTSW